MILGNPVGLRRRISGIADWTPSGGTAPPTGGNGAGWPSWDIPYTGGMQGTVCPAGTRCRGMGIDIPFVGEACLGECVEMTSGGGDLPPLAGCPEGTYPQQNPDGSVTCVEVGYGIGPGNGNGAAPMPTPTPSCAPTPECTTRHVTIQGRCGPMRVRQRWDKTKGRWVRYRRDNYMNPKANRRAASRLRGAHREAKKIIDTLDQISKPKRRRRRS